MKLRAVDFALVNTETFEVLRTSTNELVLQAIADTMRTLAKQLGNNGDCYRVMEMRRAEMGDSLYEQAIDVRWRESQRRTAHMRERPLAPLPISALR